MAVIGGYFQSLSILALIGLTVLFIFIVFHFFALIGSYVLSRLQTVNDTDLYEQRRRANNIIDSIAMTLALIIGSCLLVRLFVWIFSY